MAPPTTWMSESVDMLRRLWADGLSSSQIGDRLGRTRNAVIGKVYRLGLASRKGPRWQAPPHGKRRRSPPPSSHRPAPAPKPKPQLVFEAIESLGVPLLDLHDHHCRWPHGDPKKRDDSFGFCGRDALGSYCDYHARIAYRPASRRQR